MPHRWLFAVIAFLAASAHAQWLNFPTLGTPRTRDGKPNFAAPVPRAADGKPDLSGVWHVQPTPRPEMERLFGAGIGVVEVSGMEIGTQSKYAFNIRLAPAAGFS